jgi:hypothetical protein
MLMSTLMGTPQGGRQAFCPAIDTEVMKQAPAPRAGKSLGVLVWPLGIVATSFLCAAAMVVLMVWLPIVLLFVLNTEVLRRKKIDAGRVALVVRVRVRAGVNTRGSTRVGG